jgi:hypothetical protein
MTFAPSRIQNFTMSLEANGSFVDEFGKADADAQVETLLISVGGFDGLTEKNDKIRPKKVLKRKRFRRKFCRRRFLWH